MKMNKWLLFGTALILIGGLIFVGGTNAMQWDFTQLPGSHYETVEHVITDSFQNITVEIDTADVSFRPSADGKASVVCSENKNAKHSVSVSDDTLIIRLDDQRKWYAYIGFVFHTPKILVYLPQDTYGSLAVSSDTGDVSIPEDFRFDSISVATDTGHIDCFASALGGVQLAADTGDIQVARITADSLQLSVSTGKISVQDVTCLSGIRANVSTGDVVLSAVRCKEFVSTGNTGDISLEEVVATGKFTIERTTGDVTFRGADAAEISVTTDTGDVTGSLLSDKIFLAQTDTGRIALPGTTTGGKCTITTDTGDIKISITP